MREPGREPLPRAAVEEALETEAQEMIAAYAAHYPAESFEVIDVERTWELPLPGGRHSASGKFDGFVRGNADPYLPGKLYLLEHKTEKRGSKANLPESWAARSQVGIYQWAGEQIYGEEIAGIILDVLTRRSDAGRIGPSFRRDTLSRTREDCELAIANLNWTADQIERCREEWNGAIWPQDRNNCCVNGWRCDFYNLHVFGRSDFELQQHFQPTEKYLDL